jgi:hypothetical protein
MSFLPVKQYKLTLSGSSASQQMLPVTDESTGNYFQVRLHASADMVCKFGGSTVTASATYTSNALPDGNFTVLGGVGPEAFDIKQNQTYIAAIGTGDLYITVGYNEP